MAAAVEAQASMEPNLKAPHPLEVALLLREVMAETAAAAAAVVSSQRVLQMELAEKQAVVAMAAAAAAARELALPMPLIRYWVDQAD